MTTFALCDKADDTAIGSIVEMPSGTYQGYLPCTGGAIGTSSGTQALLMHMDGANNGTVFTDSSPIGAALTRTGAITSTAQVKYGSASGYFDGNSFVSIPWSSNFSFTGDFTVEAWVYPTSSTPTNDSMGYGNCTIAMAGTHYSSSTWFFNWSGNTNSGNISKFSFQCSDYSGNGGAAGAVVSASTYALNQWYHVAATRSGTTLSLWVNGALAGTATLSGTIGGVGASGLAMSVGQSNYGSISRNFTGYLDDLCITKGLAKYTSAFTPPGGALTTVTGPYVTNYPSLVSLLGGVTLPNVSPATDAYFNSVSLLAHMDGSNGGTTFNDSSSNAITLTPTATTISTAQSKFGGASGLFAQNSSSSLALSSNAALTLTGDFTIEMWVYPTDVSSYGFFGKAGTTRGAWANTNILYFDQAFDGSQQLYTAANFLTVNTWTHLAFVRSGSNFYIFRNGTSVSYSGTVVPSATIDLSGGYLGKTPIGYGLTGYMDEVRITKGVARYTANFTVPTAPFASALPASSESYFSSVKLLMHMDNNSTDVIGHTLASFGTPTYSATNQFGGYSYSSANSRGLYVNPATSDFNLSSGDFTVEFWIYPTSAPAGSHVVGTANPVYGGGETSGTGTTSGGGWGIRADASAITLVGNGNGQGNAAVTWTLNTWYHIAIVRSGATTTIYKNGVSIGTLTPTFASDSTNRLYIGCHTDFQSNGFPGYIDDLRITKGVARYTGNFPVPTAAFPNSNSGTVSTAYYIRSDV
jgi:hypothetical protein